MSLKRFIKLTIIFIVIVSVLFTVYLVRCGLQYVGLTVYRSHLSGITINAPLELLWRCYSQTELFPSTFL